MGKVILDPGHGGEDPGAEGILDGYSESDYTMEQAEICSLVLRRRGWEVVWTRTDDINVSESASARLANAEEADVYISLHANGAGPTAHGYEVLYWHSSTRGADLADTIVKILAEYVGTGMRNRGIHPRYPRSEKGHSPHEYRGATVLGKTNMPAVIVEAGFISNYHDATALQSLAYQVLLAQAIADAIEEVIEFE